jgi:hypothetical protein
VADLNSIVGRSRLTVPIDLHAPKYDVKVDISLIRKPRGLLHDVRAIKYSYDSRK